MGCKKLTYYENQAPQLRVVPAESRSVVIIAYRIELENGNIVQGWFTPDPAEQFANPYLAMGCNPVVYVDPDGEFIFTALALITGQLWALPIAIGADLGAFTGGIRGAMNPEVGFWVGAGRGAAVGAVGGALSMAGGAGMTFAANLALGTGQGAITGAMDAALWGTDIGKGALWGAAGGAAFTTITSENLSNSLHGKGFKTNSNVFEDFASGEYTTSTGVWQQDALDYFGFDGEYAPDIYAFDAKRGGDPNALGGVDTDGNIFYNDFKTFDSYDNLSAVHEKELFTSSRIRSGDYSDFTPNGILNEEYKGFLHIYRNQGLYPNHTTPLINGLDSYGKAIGLPKMTSFDFETGINEFYFKQKWIHFFYRIPRRF